ncbi:hypothetical protein [Zoogloea sp. LCSB751]|uniref:hypothetical protein n=1 Tax=Zoogloea sp. LCSB751 TaxID=1965277 RepID=UPI0009A4B10D|nr:hypothetical protein [Zoogloea sp. LCSB751]
MSTQLNFPATIGTLYLLAEDADALALVDQFSARQVQLLSLLAMTYGDAGDAFRRLSPALQDNYLWACSMLAREMQDLFEALRARRAM